MHVLHTQQRLQQFWLDTCRFDGRVLFEYGCRGAVVGLLAYQSSRWGLGEYGIDFNTVLLLSFGLLVGWKVSADCGAKFVQRLAAVPLCFVAMVTGELGSLMARQVGQTSGWRPLAAMGNAVLGYSPIIDRIHYFETTWMLLLCSLGSGLGFGVPMMLVGRSRRVTLSTLWVVVAVTLTMAVMFFWGWYREPRLQLLVVALGQISVAIAVALRIPAFRTETIDPSGVG